LDSVIFFSEAVRVSIYTPEPSESFDQLLENKYMFNSELYKIHSKLGFSFSSFNQSWISNFAGNYTYILDDLVKIFLAQILVLNEESNMVQEHSFAEKKLHL
jgi:hypothetical protein